MTEDFFDKLESVKFEPSAHQGLKHSKIIFQVPSQTRPKTSIYITFHDTYDIITEVINAVKRMIDFEYLDQPTD